VDEGWADFGVKNSASVCNRSLPKIPIHISKETVDMIRAAAAAPAAAVIQKPIAPTPTRSKGSQTAAMTTPSAIKASSSSGQRSRTVQTEIVASRSQLVQTAAVKKVKQTTIATQTAAEKKVIRPTTAATQTSAKGDCSCQCHSKKKELGAGAEKKVVEVLANRGGEYYVMYTDSTEPVWERESTLDGGLIRNFKERANPELYSPPKETQSSPSSRRVSRRSKAATAETATSPPPPTAPPPTTALAAAATVADASLTDADESQSQKSVRSEVVLRLVDIGRKLNGKTVLSVNGDNALNEVDMEPVDAPPPPPTLLSKSSAPEEQHDTRARPRRKSGSPTKIIVPSKEPPQQELKLEAVAAAGERRARRKPIKPAKVTVDPAQGQVEEIVQNVIDIAEVDQHLGQASIANLASEAPSSTKKRGRPKSKQHPKEATAKSLEPEHGEERSKVSRVVLNTSPFPSELEDSDGERKSKRKEITSGGALRQRRSSATKALSRFKRGWGAGGGAQSDSVEDESDSNRLKSTDTNDEDLVVNEDNFDAVVNDFQAELEKDQSPTRADMKLVDGARKSSKTSDELVREKGRLEKEEARRRTLLINKLSKGEVDEVEEENGDGDYRPTKGSDIEEIPEGDETSSQKCGKDELFLHFLLQFSTR
jgi:hypothetical protein